jgi:hypothetical protein
LATAGVSFAGVVVLVVVSPVAAAGAFASLLLQADNRMIKIANRVRDVFILNGLSVGFFL